MRLFCQAPPETAAMAESKAEPTYHHSLVVDVPQESDTKACENVVKKKEKRKRLDSLDIFRGLTVAV